MDSNPGWKSASLAKEEFSPAEKRKRKNSLLQYLTVTGYCLHLLLLVVLFMSLTQFMDLQPDPLIWAVTAGVLLVATIAERYRRYSAWLAGVLAVSSLFFLILGIRRWPHLIEAAWDFVSRWLQFLHEGYLRTLTTVPAELGYFTGWLIMFLLAVWGCALIRRQKPWPIVIAGAGVLSFQWFFHFDAAETFLRSYVAAAIPLVAILQGIRWLNNTPAESLTRFSLGPLLRWVALLTAFTLLFSVMLPVQPAAWRLTTVRRWITETVPFLQQLRGENGGPNGRPVHTFSLQSSGYGSSKQLGGPLQLDESPAFKVVLQPATVRVQDLPFPLYMRGRTLAHYTGRGWTPGEESWEWFESDERLPSLYPGNVSTRTVSKSLTALNLQTGSIFSSGDLREVALPEPLQESGEDVDEVVAKSNRGDVIAHQQITSEMQYEFQTSIPYWEIDKEQITDETQEETSEDLQPYLQLPDELPDRVIQLAGQITEDEEDSYAKARAIADYLRDLPYSIDVSEVPEDRDFTDFFLFDEQTGYCTYHSTAMAVMLRAVGIPTRWVKGFVLREQDLQPVEDEPEDSAQQATVSLSSAHAWVEVWIEDTGWLLFEPTPLYSSIDHDRHPPERETTDVGRDPSDPADDPDRPFDPFEEEIIENGYPRAPQRPLWPIVLARFITGLFAAAILAAGGMYAVARWQEHSLLQRSTERFVHADRCQSTQTVLVATAMAQHTISRYLNLDPEGLTIREFAKRAADESEHVGEALLRLADLYEPVAYGGLLSSPAAAIAASHHLSLVLQDIKQQLGLANYALLRLLPLFPSRSAFEVRPPQ